MSGWFLDVARWLRLQQYAHARNIYGARITWHSLTLRDVSTWVMSVPVCTACCAMAGAGGAWCTGRILDVIKSLYAHDSAAVRSSEGLSAIFRCLMGVKQGCPLSPTLFGLYVDGLEKHLLATLDIDAPTLRGVLVPLLLYADDLILMSTSAAGLQKQLDALASFCDQR